MTLYSPGPVFTDNVGQLLSHEDLEIIRSNVAYVEALSYRLMPGLASSGGVETGTAGYYAPHANVPIWFGNLRFQTGLTTLHVEGTASGYGSAQIKVYVDGVLRITAALGATWSGTWTISGLTDGQVVALEVDIAATSGTVATTAQVVVEAIYATPIVYSPTWPGTPTFTTAWTAAKLNQLDNAIIWLMNRMNSVPIRPDMADLFALGPFADSGSPPPRRPIYYGGTGRWFTNSQFRCAGQVWNGSSVSLRLEIELNGVLVYTSPDLAIGTTIIQVVLPLSSYTIGANIQVAIWGNCLDEGPISTDGAFHFSRFTINAARSEIDSSAAIYTTLSSTPAADTPIAVATLAAYLNSLSSTVLATYNRIIATTTVWDRVWAVRRWFSKTNTWDDTGRGRGRPRFIRTGDRLIVRGKGVQVAWGPMTVENTERGMDFDGYSFLNNQSVIDGDKIQTQVVYLDSLPGLPIGEPYYLLGDVSWASESLL